MTKLPEYRCPVCRATRPGQDQCRRCQADLRLVQRCWETSNRLLVRCKAIDAAMDSAERVELEHRLKLFAPRLLESD